MGEGINAYFLEDRHFEKGDDFPYSINPLSFSDYEEETILNICKSYGWAKPEDTDANSTNWLLNGLANEVHLKQYGFHPYALEVAGLIREGCMTREEGVKRLAEPSDPEVMEYVRKRLGITKTRKEKTSKWQMKKNFITKIGKDEIAKGINE